MEARCEHENRETHRLRTNGAEIAFDVPTGAWMASAAGKRWGTAASPIATGRGEGSREAACSAPSPWPNTHYPDALPTIVLNTHHGCDLRCRYCYAHPTEEDYHRPPMTVETARRAVGFLLTDLGSAAPRVAVEHPLLGDPTQAPAFFEDLAEYARTEAAACGKELRWPQGATMNMAARSAEEIVRRFPQWVGASLDGPAEVHDALRPFADGRGSHQVVTDNMRRIMSGESPGIGATVHVQAILTSLEPSVTRLFRHFMDLGVEGISIRPVRLPPGHPLAIDEDSIEQIKAGYTEFGEFLLSQEPDGLLACLRPILHIWDFFGRFLLRVLRPQKVPYRCPAGKWYVAVDTDGALYPCAPFAGARQLPMGSVFSGIDGKSQQFWAEQLFIENRASCRTCWARYLCGGGCYYQAFLATGRPDRPDPVECELTRHVAEVALRVAAALHRRGPEVLEAIPEDVIPRQRAAPQPVMCVKLDGALPGDEISADWRSPHPLVLADRSLVRWKRWRGPDDLSAEVHFGWDRANLHVRAVVRDDTLVPAWKQPASQAGDSFELSIYPPADRGYRRAFLMRWHHEGGSVLAYTEDEPSDLRSLVETRARCAVMRSGDCTDYRLAIPWQELPGLLTADEWPVALVINDDDTSSRGYLRWPADSGCGRVRIEGR